MAKKEINKLNTESISKKIEKVAKVKKGKSTEIEKIFTRHASPREVIEHVKHKLYSIESGKIRYFNPIKGEGFIMPNDGSPDIYTQDFGRLFKDGEVVNYININHEALVASSGQIRIKNKHAGEYADKILIIVDPDDNDKKTVELFMEPTFPHNKVEGHGNVADKSKPEYPIDISSFNEGDEVEFVANKKGIIVAIQKK